MCIFLHIFIAVTGLGLLLHFVVINAGRPWRSGGDFGVIREAELRPVVLSFGVGPRIVNATVYDENLVGALRSIVSVWSAHGLPGGIRTHDIGGIWPYWKHFAFPLIPEGFNFPFPGYYTSPGVNVGSVGGWRLSVVLHQDGYSALNIWRGAKNFKTEPRAVFKHELFGSIAVSREHGAQLEGINDENAEAYHYSANFNPKFNIFFPKLYKAHRFLLFIFSLFGSFWFSGYFLIYSGRYGSFHLGKCLLSLLLAFIFTAHAVFLIVVLN